MVKNLKDLMTRFKDEDVCREYLVKQLWNGVPVCPYCGCTKSYRIENGKRFKCGNSACYKKYSVTVGTVFHASNIPLSTWFPAMYLIASNKKGISSIQLGKHLGVTQKTAWFMMHRIREALKEKNSPLLGGIVEVDETYMSRKYGSEYKGIPAGEYVERETIHKKRNKGAVVGLKEREGNIIVTAIDSRKAETVTEIVTKNVSKDAQLMTDEAMIYRKGLSDYNRQSVNHSKGEWVRGNVHTNGVENFWSVMKRTIYGTWHQISYKHLQRYCDECSYRYNSRKMADGVRFELSLQKLQGRLSYKQLIQNGKSSEESPSKEA